MSILQPRKIFIDPKEEITFIIDKVISSDEDKIIIIAPENSIIFNSQISLDILFRQASLANKLLIIVTEDTFGTRIAQRSRYVVVSKVSQITNDLWDAALTRKQGLISELADKKKIIAGESIIKEDNKNLIDSYEIVPAEVKHKEENLNSEKIEKDISNEEIEDKKNDEEINIHSLFKKPKIEPKVIDFKGIQVMAGGDINQFLNKESDDKMYDNLDIIDEDMADDNFMTGKSFAGRDFTRKIDKKKGLGKFLGFGKKDPKPSELNDRKVGEGVGGEGELLKKNKNKVLIISVIVGISVLVFGYFVVFVIPSTDLKITLRQENVAAAETITASTSIDEVDTQTLTIPGLLVEEEQISISKTGTANGEGRSGNKAKGFINIYNKTNQTVNLPAGTKVKSTGGLEYVITEIVNLDANTVEDEPGVTNASIVENVPIEAVTFGTQYNITDSTSNTVFTIDGFGGVSEIEGKRISVIEGGTEETFVTVSQDNKDKLKETIMPEIEAQGKQRIRTASPRGYRLIEESITFKETKVDALPDLNEKVTDGIFTLTVEVTVSAIAVSEDDLETVVGFILEDQGDNTENFQLGNIEDLEIKDVKRNENDITFTLSSNSIITPSVVEDEIIEEIQGKSYSEAREILEDNENISDYRLVFSPFFVPDFLRYVPSDESKIDITIE